MDARRRCAASRVTRIKDGSNLDRSEIEAVGQGDQFAEEEARERHGWMTGWQPPIEDPINLPDGRSLVTLKQAADYILKLPKVEQNHADWQTAIGCLIRTAEGRDFLMHARMLQALNHGKPNPNITPSRKKVAKGSSDDNRLDLRRYQQTGW
jgi:hypothetical protein